MFKIKGTKTEILIFGNKEEGKERNALINALVSNGVNRVILVDFEQIYQKLFGNAKERISFGEIEGSSILGNNPKKLPIIFYGGNQEDYFFLIRFFCWQGRKDMGWVHNPHQIEDIIEIINNTEISKL